MNASIHKNSDLFFRALDDLWCAEQIYKGSPNNAAWHCNQCIEKFLKGILKCYEKEYSYDHRLEGLLEILENIVEVTEDAGKNILYINNFGNALRYKNMKTDPTPEEIKLAIGKVKSIIEELNSLEKSKIYYAEALEVHGKMTKLV